MAILRFLEVIMLHNCFYWSFFQTWYYSPILLCTNPLAKFCGWKKIPAPLDCCKGSVFSVYLHTQFWIDNVFAVVYLINRTPSKFLQFDTPSAKLYKCSSSYSDLRVFGCLAFVYTRPVGKSKFSPRARLCVFLGYPSRIKGYKLLGFHTHEAFISRDVIFDEDVFPFETTNPSGFTSNPFDTIALPRLDNPSASLTDLSNPSPIISHTSPDSPHLFPH